MCLVLLKVLSRYETKHKANFLQSVKVTAVNLAIQKCHAFNFLNKIFAMRNLIIRLTYNISTLYRSYFLRWRFYNMEKQKLISDRQSRLLKIVDDVRTHNNREVIGNKGSLGNSLLLKGLKHLISSAFSRRDNHTPRSFL